MEVGAAVRGGGRSVPRGRRPPGGEPRPDADDRGDGHAQCRPRVPPRDNRGAGAACNRHQEGPQTPTVAESGVTPRDSTAVMHIEREGREKQSCRTCSDTA